MYLARNATRAVEQALEWSPVVLVEGPRQAGKSVLVRDLVGAHRPVPYVTLDDALTVASGQQDPQGFVFSLADPVIIDEIQRVPELALPIKLSVDQDRRPGRFTLTGSANVLLLPRLSDSLAGRMCTVTLWPLSQGEIAGVREDFLTEAFADAPMPTRQGSGSREGVAARITRGGFPEAVSLPEGVVRDGWMRAYATTLLDRDVRDLAAITDRVALPRLLRLLAARSGTLLNASDLSRTIGMARATFDRYSALFTKTFTVQFVPAWAGDVSRRLVRSPKILFVDSGLCAHLVGLDAKRLIDDPNTLGALLETFVGSELLKQIAIADEHLELLHYRDSHGSEVDWVVEDSRGRLVGVEVKASASPSEHAFRGLRSFAATVGKRFHRGIVLHTGPSAAPMGEGMWALPIDALWHGGPAL